MVRNKIQDLAHAVRLQLRDPSVIIRPRPDRRVQLVMISDVVTVQTLGAGLEIGRCIHVAHPELLEVSDDFSRVRKCETPIELQPVRARRNAWMLLFHSRKKTSDAQRLTSNAQ